MKTVLPFEALPKGLPFGGKITYCVVDISGIQSYIFHAMDRHTTPAEIRSRSEFISRLTGEIHRRLTRFPGYLFGSVSSGKLLCGFHPSTKEHALREFLDRLQRTVFASTQGRLTFYYALCQSKCIPEHRFRNTDMQHAGAVLGQLLEEEKYHCLNLLSADMEQEADPLLTPVDSSITSPAREENQGVVKLDLDNLGAFFRDITAYDRRHRVSMALEAAIDTCLKADARIETVFAGGDDIFFLCPLSEYLSVISCFYRRLRKLLKESPELRGYEQNFFGISAGICVLRNQLDQIPLLSYWESAENALRIAKTKGGKNCLYVQLPSKELLYISWENLCLLSDIYTRLREPLHAQHRFTGADIAHVGVLAEQLSICGRYGNQLTKKELSRLYEIKKQSV